MWAGNHRLPNEMMGRDYISWQIWKSFDLDHRFLILFAAYKGVELYSDATLLSPLPAQFIAMAILSSLSPASDSFIMRWASRVAVLCVFLSFLNYLDSIRVRFNIVLIFS